MALQITYETGMGITASNCYAKIAHFTGNKNEISFHVEFFYDQSARENFKGAISGSDYIIPTPTTDLLPALYNHLKTLSEFSGAIDV